VKRIIFYFLIGVFFITSVTACSNQDSIPDGMSEKTYSIAKQVLEITNDLLDDKLTSDEAYSEIKELYDELQQNMSNNSDSSSYDSLVKTAIESILSNVKSLDGSNAANLSTHAISLGKDLLEQYLGISSN
jgi:septation ring formation regulator EzrA